MTINPELLEKAWPSSWVAHPDAPARDYGVFHFRRTFALAEIPASFVVHTSADNRYRLFVNGLVAVEGPCRGDLGRWYFETTDIAHYLRRGRNVVAVTVWNFGEHMPLAQIAHRTRFLCQGDTRESRVLDTRAGGGWKVLHDPAYAPRTECRGRWIFPSVGACERVDAGRYPWGWTAPAYDDSGWRDAANVSFRPVPRGDRSWGSVSCLAPRPIPPMERRVQRFASVVRSSGAPVPAGFPAAPGRVTVPPRTKAQILLDNGALTTAYPVFCFEGGRAARTRLWYAEALSRGGEKGHRNEVGGRDVEGYGDEIVSDGGRDRVYRPLWWRTFRYLLVEIETVDEPLTVTDLFSEFTAYPFTESGSFHADDPELETIWRTGWRTARLCAHETYLDCPYYEQLQYVGDTRVQAMISYYVAGDDRLARKAILQFDDSRLPEGLTQSQYPSHYIQVIPPFSLQWIGMVHDFMLHRDDFSFVFERVGGIDAVIQWFLGHLDPRTRLLGPLPWWNFVDWAVSWEAGVPPGAADGGGSAVVSLMLARALQESADISSALGQEGRAEAIAGMAGVVRRAVRRLCWDEGRGLLADTPEKESFSQHANILGVLSGAVPANRRRRVMERVLADPSLTQATYYFRYYLARALAAAGLADRYVGLLDPWRGMLALGLGTWAEKPEPTRSDCHAWSAHPTCDLLAFVCGVRPAEPGFKSVAIEPHPGPLQRVSGTVPHPLGPIEVAVERVGPRRIRAAVSLPENLPGTVRWGGKTVAIGPGRSEVLL